MFNTIVVVVSKKFLFFTVRSNTATLTVILPETTTGPETIAHTIEEAATKVYSTQQHPSAGK